MINSEVIRNLFILLYQSSFLPSSENMVCACVIVGGQSAAYWMRLPGSTDIDFVTPGYSKITIALEQCGFIRSADMSFRYVHTKTNIMIELLVSTLLLEM